ncbi:MAG: hypothetical protein II891_06240 [Bacteroidales bacterium]|nr:hypothetical protein [Bacteroidales bacterium]
MKRLLFHIICLLLCCSPAFAGGRGVPRIGIDWGYGMEVYRYWNLIYLDSEMGYVVQDQDSEVPARPYAYCSLSVGFEPTSWMGLSAFSGIMGVSKDRLLVPLGLQTNISPRGNAMSGPIFILAGGIAFNTDFSYSKAAFGTLGAGWRFSLNDAWNLDLLLRSRILRDSPPIWDEENRNYVEKSLIRKDYTLIGSLEFGIAISF